VSGTANCQPDGAEPFLRIERAPLRSVARSAPLRHVTRSLHDGIRALIAALELEPGARVLDLGCADQPYRDWLPNGVGYVGADISGNDLADALIDESGRVALADASFDAVLSTQVLEHVTDPERYLAEAFRVLLPGGSLALTTHGLMRLHRDPIDLWRWTSDGLRHQLQTAGFDVVRQWGIVGAAATGVQLFQDSTVRRLPGRLRTPYTALLQAMAGWVDQRQSQADKDQDAMVFAVIAARPERPAP
jgi:SAM-dependent methyltransferase